jgi:hypothetical protein
MLIRAPKTETDLAQQIRNATEDLRCFLLTSESSEFVRARDHYRQLRDQRAVERETFAALCIRAREGKHANPVRLREDMAAAEKRLEALERKIDIARGKYIEVRDGWLPGIKDAAMARLPQGDAAIVQAAELLEGVVDFYETLDTFVRAHGLESHVARSLTQKTAQLRAMVRKK